jgi:hypothetical protein
MSEVQMAYIGLGACGCLRMAVVDDPAHTRETARQIAMAVKLGETVERVTVEQVRTMPWRCAEHPTEAAFRKAQKVAKREVRP